MVADEVRSLVIRATDAAKATEELIQESVKKIKSGSEIVLKTNETFPRVSAEEMNTQVGEMRDYVKDLLVLLGAKKEYEIFSGETLRMESKDQVPTTDYSHSRKGQRMKLSDPFHLARL